MNDTDLALYTSELAEPNRMIFVGYQTRDGKYHIHCPNFIDEVDNKLYWKDDRGDYCTRTDWPLLTDLIKSKEENKLDTIIYLLTSINEKLSDKKEVQLEADKLIEQILEEESTYTPPKEDIRKLYVKRVRNNELVEIGSFRYGSRHRSKLNLPEGRRPNICDVMRINATMNRYYPGWFYYDDEVLQRTLIDYSYKHIVVDNDYVVGISNGVCNFYYDDFS